MKKLLILSALLIVSVNAYECTSKSTNGQTFHTMSDTYNIRDSIKSMWFKWETKVNGKIIETGKQKVEVKNNQYRTVMGISYDKNGVVKSSLDDGYYKNFNEPFPETMMIWMMNVIHGWEYSNAYGEDCDIVLAIGDIKRRIPDFDIKVVHNYLEQIHKNNTSLAASLNTPDGWEKIWMNIPDQKQPSMTIEETKKWLEENDPKKVGSK